MNNILVVALTNSLTHLKFDYFQIRRIWLEAIFPSLTRPRQLLFASGFFANLEDLWNNSRRCSEGKFNINKNIYFIVSTS